MKGTEANLMQLEGKTVIVTGAGSDRGIGRSIALGFAREGADIVVADLNGQDATRVAHEIENLGRNALAITVDVSRPADVGRMMQATVERFGGVDILVNNVGAVRFAPFLETTEELWDWSHAVNLKSQFLCSQAAARRMVEQGSGGVILCITSVGAEAGHEEQAAYCSAKAGAKNLMMGMAVELARHRIRVNAIAPGGADTNFIKEPRRQRMRARPEADAAIPWGRRGTPEDIVGTTVFLASDAAEYITGTTITVDGGTTAGHMLPSEWRGEGEPSQPR